MNIYYGHINEVYFMNKCICDEVLYIYKKKRLRKFHGFCFIYSMQGFSRNLMPLSGVDKVQYKQHNAFGI